MPTTSNFGWTTPADTDLVKDGALAIRTLGNGIDTSMAQLKGGTTGQVLSKTSNTDMAFTWVTQDDANAIQNAIVDAKGDLIAATANDTPARLAVGNNGETLVADSSQTTGLRYNPPVGSLANPVINGGMDIWQRGTSVSVAASTQFAYTADRWALGTGANQAATVSRQSTGDTTNLPNIQYSARVQRNSGQTGTSSFYFVNNFETVNSIPYAGKTVTLTFYAKAGTNFSPTSGIFFGQIFSGTGTDQNLQQGYTNLNTVASSSLTATTTWQRFAVTGTIPATATEIALRIEFVPTGTAGANDWIEVTGFQLDVGTWTATTAPTFRRSGGTLAGELAACQRYYYRITSDVLYGTLANFGIAYSTGAVLGYVQFPVKMRTTPTSIDPSALNTFYWDRGDIGAGNTASTVTLDGTTSSNVGVFQLSKAASFVANFPYRILSNNTNAAFVGFNAEL